MGKHLFLALVLVACGLPGVSGQGGSEVTGRDIFEPRDNFVPPEADAPGFAVFSITPSRGPTSGGTRVEVSGVGFLPGSKVVFGASAGVDPTVETSNTIKVTTPPHPPGLVKVYVVRPDDKVAFLDDAFFFESSVTVESVEPNVGPTQGGTPITVKGQGFLPDSMLIIGGRLAWQVHVLSEQTIIALTPPGKAGPRDVVVQNMMGSGLAHRAFRYADLPKVSHCEPALALVGEHVEVLLRGSGLDVVEHVLAPNCEVAVQEIYPTAIKMAIAPQMPGPIGFNLTTPFGIAAVPACVWAVQKEDLESATPRIFGVTPPYGSVLGGQERRAIVFGIKGLTKDQVTIYFGSAKATVLSVAEHEVVVKTPAHAEGKVDCSIKTPTGSDKAEAVFEYVPQVVLSAVEPNFGPLCAATDATLKGDRLDRVAQVFIDAFPASILAKDISAIRMITPPLSPGLHNVRALTDWGETVVLENAFACDDGKRSFLALSPDRGSIAGGTLVALLGSGMDKVEQVSFGSATATITDARDPSRLLVRTPPGNAGAVDVQVSWPDGLTLSRRQAFTYFDPTGYFGGVWGDVVQGAVNVTVLDSYNGKPVPLAFVIMGSDIATAYQGTTDLRGQITFSGEDVMGPVQVTASRLDYSTMSIVGVDAENITLFIEPAVPVSSGGGSTSQPLPPGIVQGKVLGADKYMLAPPAPCADRPLIYGVLCKPCKSDGDCDNGYCVNPLGVGFFCATACSAPADCPQGYLCYPLGEQRNGCLPAPGYPEIRCGTSVKGIGSSPLDPGPGAIVGENGLYALNARIGEIAVYCVGGFISDSGKFLPSVLGIRRHVQVYPGQLTSGQDIRLEIPLDRVLKVRLLNVPGGPTGPYVHSVRLALNLGSDGYLKLWDDQVMLDGEWFEFSAIPRSLSGALDGARFDVWAEADSPSDTGVPYSASVERGFVLDETSNSIRLKVANDQAFGEIVETQVSGDVLGGCYAINRSYLVGDRGRIWQIGPETDVKVLPAPGLQALRGCAALDDGTVLVVGDGGLIARVDEQTVSLEPAPSASRLYGVTVADNGHVFAVGESGLLKKEIGQDWTSLSTGTKAPLYAVARGILGIQALAVGSKGTVIAIEHQGPRLLANLPSKRDLFAVAPSNNAYVIVGARGTIIIGDPEEGFTRVESNTIADLLSVIIVDSGALIGGAAGTLLWLKDNAVRPVLMPSMRSEVTAIVPSKDTGSYLAFTSASAAVGPFLHIPLFSSPQAAAVWSSLELQWSLPSPPSPSFSYTRISGTKAARQWEILAKGDITEIELPDLTKAAGIVPLPFGELRLYALHVLLDYFDFNSFDTNSFSMYSWRSYAVQQFIFNRK